MKINYKVVSSILAAGLVWDFYAMEVNKSRFNKLVKHNQMMRDELKDRARLINLYAKKLNENGVKMDDFEQIVMDELIK